jgi:hypothetical protein
LNPKTVTKWRGRQSTIDAAMGPRDPHSTVLSAAEEAMVVEFRQIFHLSRCSNLASHLFRWALGRLVNDPLHYD